MRYSGKIGYVATVETRPGIWEPVTTERPGKGDVLVRRVTNTTTGPLTGDTSLSYEVSIVADSYAKQNFGCIKYAEYCRQKWAVTSAVLEPPRIRMTLGGLWNEQTN